MTLVHPALRAVRRCAAAVVLAVLAGQAAAQPAAPSDSAEVMAVDLREDIQRIPVTVKNLYGREETRTIPLTVFRPAGDGPFPLVIFSHGRAVSERRAQQGRQRFESLSRYLVGKGFVVFVPTRVGYGETYGDFDPEDSGSCNAPRLEPVSIAASDQVLATLAHAKTLPYVDASRWVAMGQSVGGLTTVAVAWRNPPGLVAAVNFAGGIGGNPDTRPGDPCQPGATERLWGAKAATATVPMLWLYWENDKYWGAENPKRWARAWADGGGRVEFHSLPAFGNDGHVGSGNDMDRWVPLVEAYLAKAGFTRSGLVPRPAPSGFAKLDEVDKLPAPATGPGAREALYRRFLAARPPRAFAIGPNGSGFATGDWALGRALGFCQARRGQPCKLYAVDDDVVWTP